LLIKLFILIDASKNIKTKGRRSSPFIRRIETQRRGGEKIIGGIEEILNVRRRGYKVDNEINRFRLKMPIT